MRTRTISIDLSAILLYCSAIESLSFVYHPMFDRTADGVLTDDQMITVEDMLIADPRKGDVIPSTGGARKVRVP
jgi:hypothetical protein